MAALSYHHVDVFSDRPFSGNSLTVFPDVRDLAAHQMLRITQEMRHFESVFLERTCEAGTYKAQVFDLIGELDFAGHPLIGAAGVLHELSGQPDSAHWTFVLKHKTVAIATQRTAFGFTAMMDQGRPEFIGELAPDQVAEFAAALKLAPTDLAAEHPPEIVSTGLRYLIVPVAAGLDRAAIVRPDFDAMLRSVGAQFAYLLDLRAMEGRHWNNDGILEDVATGSAAGAVGAYLLKRGLGRPNTEFVLHQGRFVGRPSQIRVRAIGSPEAVERILVGGDIAHVGRGRLTLLPEIAA